MLLREIAKREEVSEKYLSNLVNPLKARGLVEATRGVHGGYVLGKGPSEITMKEIVEALEGSLCIVDCVEKPAACGRAAFCVARDLWSEAAQGLIGFWKNTPWPTWCCGKRRSGRTSCLTITRFKNIS